MRKTILSVITAAFFAGLLQSQELKKPHQFLLPEGTSIQHKTLSKPKYISAKLDSRASDDVNIRYKSIPSGVLEQFCTDITIETYDANGNPSRFKSKAIRQTDGESIAAFWSHHLPEVLSIDPKAGIEFKLRSEETDDAGIIHLKYDQKFEGLPVLDAEYYVHIYKDLSIMAHGNFRQPSNALQSKLSLNDATTIAIKHLSDNGIKCTEPKSGQASWLKLGLQSSVMGYLEQTSDKSWHLVYQLDIFPNAMSRWLVTVDAITGEILKSLPNTCLFHNHDEASRVEPEIHAPDPLGAEQTTARDLFDITRTINVWREGSSVYLLDGSRPMFKPSLFKLDDPVGAIWTLDGLNSNPNDIRVDHVKTSSNTWPKNAVSAHYNAGLAYEYYTNTHSRNSINGSGGSIISIVNINDESGGGLDNAFWNGEAMFYGNGAQAFNSLARGLDVAGHEMSHGVIQSTANLTYEGESGAINESFADVFGAMIDRNDWKIGEDVVRLNVFPSGALRDMSDPHNGAQKGDYSKWQPKHVNEQYTGSQDNGGVHINSGIPNYAFYSFVQELAIGSTEEQAKKTAEKIYYRTLNQYLTRSSNFKDLRSAVEQACIDLHGNNSAIHNAAKNAFAKVGIGPASNPGGGNYQKDLAVNPGKEFIVCTNDFNEGVYLFDVDKGTYIVLSNQIIKSKPSVTDDGTEIYFVGDDSRLYALYFNKPLGIYEEFVLDATQIYRNASISKDGALLSVLYEQEENKIHVYKFQGAVWKVYTLTNPTTSSGVSTGNVRYADYMDFEPSNQYLMYDCLSKLERSTGGSYEYWDVGFLRVWDPITKTFGDGHIEKLFSSLPDNTSVGNPVYSKNSPYIIAFDFLEENQSLPFSILGANIETGDVGEIASGREDTGYPSYSVKDDILLYNGVNNMGDECLVYSPLAANKIQAGGFEETYVCNARWGNWFANGKRSLVGAKDPGVYNELKIYPNPFTSSIKLDIESNSDQVLNYSLYNLMGQSVYQSKIELLNGRNIIELPLQHTSPGIYYLKLKGADGESGFIISKMEE